MFKILNLLFFYCSFTSNKKKREQRIFFGWKFLSAFNLNDGSYRRSKKLVCFEETIAKRRWLFSRSPPSSLHSCHSYSFLCCRHYKSICGRANQLLVNILMKLSASTNRYFTQFIWIRVPAQFTGSFESYTNRLCWLQNTYYVAEHEDIPDNLHERNKTMLKYYQWIHLIILFQTFLFLIPRIIW